MKKQYIPKRADVQDAFEGREVDPTSLTPKQRLAHVAGWHLGYTGWEETILGWVKDCGFKVEG